MSGGLCGEELSSAGAAWFGLGAFLPSQCNAVSGLCLGSLGQTGEVAAVRGLRWAMGKREGTSGCALLGWT